MYPHERSLVKRLENKPFALLGVNTEDSPEFLKNMRQKGEITWRFWLDKGPIADRWNVEGLPTIYILDHKGVIRFRFLGNPGDSTLDKVIEELLRELETA